MFIRLIKKLLRILGIKYFLHQFQSQFITEFKLQKWNKELFLYDGSLLKHEPQYMDQRFVGLALLRRHYREITCDLNRRLPLPDCCADAF